ncbi:hypothetical protein Xen7305DRAFT_00021500 [Xenococcus sp. PCC 7305]|nr:hypothetical protein Xen7305DRAFT_00021500 [Xenococcus sp. PCC 7305]
MYTWIHIIMYGRFYNCNFYEFFNFKVTIAIELQ